jgi:flavin reductase (DIM6/NTAB) family NADH-FMN oxidoreductase RutF
MAIDAAAARLAVGPHAAGPVTALAQQAPASRAAAQKDAERRRRRFRQVAGRFPTGVTVLSTLIGAEPYGMTANAFTTVSLDPLLVLVCVNRRARMYRALSSAGVFAVTVLGAGQEAASRHFAQPGRPIGKSGFGDFRWIGSPASGCPVLHDGVAYFDCAVTEMHPAGDHCLVLARVLDFAVLGDDAALLFRDGRYG